jgi:hypothetical protein
MIRALLLVLALGACAPRAPANCEFTAERDAAFTSAEPTDRIIARSLGPSCDKAVATLIVTSAEGHPVWAFAAPLPRVFGDDYLSPPSEEVEALLQRWTESAVLRTSAAPAWPRSMLHHPAGVAVALDRDTYADIRERDLPMLCHLTSPARETCVFYEPAAAGAAALYEREVENP